MCPWLMKMRRTSPSERPSRSKPASRASRPSRVPIPASKRATPPPSSSITYTFAGPPASANGTGTGIRWTPRRARAAVMMPKRLLQLLDLFGELGERLEEIAHQAVVGHLEDRRLGVLVDGDDGLAALHSGEVLDGAGDASRDVELRRHHLAGLADLEIVGL